MIDCPCRYCKDRFLHCHSGCIRYAEYRAMIETLNEKRKQARKDNQHGKAIDTATIRKIYKKAGGRSVNIQSR